MGRSTGSQSLGSELDQHWRLPTTEGRTWRLATAADIPRLHELWDEMDRKLGKQDRPKLHEMPVCLVLVAEDDAGVVQTGLYAEAVVDWTMIGTDRPAARTIIHLWPWLFDHLYERSIRTSRVVVPIRMRKFMARRLPEMRDITDLFAQFACTLRR